MQLSQKLFRGPLTTLFWSGHEGNISDTLDIKLKKPLPVYRKLLQVPSSLQISYSQKANITTVLVDLNEEIHCGRVILQTFMLEGRIVPSDTHGAQWTTVNKSGEAPLDGMYAWSFFPEEMGEYQFRARYDADVPDCPFDSIGWTEAESVLLR